MISVLHLIWIIPLSAWFGFALAALMVAAKKGAGADMIVTINEEI